MFEILFNGLPSIKLKFGIEKCYLIVEICIVVLIQTNCLAINFNYCSTTKAIIKTIEMLSDI